jgi:hypothetical protein
MFIENKITIQKPFISEDRESNVYMLPRNISGSIEKLF